MASHQSSEEMIRRLAEGARAASHTLAQLSTTKKNEALARIASGLEANAERIIAANKDDVKQARDTGLSKAMLDRLTLTEARITGMAKGLREIIGLQDPVGETVSMTTRPNGLQVGRIRVPLGVIGIIYESRPNVTIDASGLCLKSGNAVILRGGSEAAESNRILIDIVALGLNDVGLPQESIQLVSTTDREAVFALVKQRGLVDLIIARGSSSMIHALSEAATVPMVEHGGGVCHIYIHEAAEINKAIPIAINSKVNRPGVCNSAETFLIDDRIKAAVLPELCRQLSEKQVVIKGCERVREIVPEALVAEDVDWATEYLDLIVSIKVVEGLQDALQHIETYSTRHSDAIVTQDYSVAREFLSKVDSAAVFVNASTRFTDGNEFGLGAEIGISTQKLHARGPMGLVELTSSKFVIYGDGQTRQ